MLANAQTCAVIGLDGFVVQVEVDISPGLPVFNIVGLPDAAVQEAKERVRAALRNSGCEFPLRRITVNLAPADLKKEGPAYDLPIAVCMLLSSGQIDSVPDRAVFLGELSLEGALRHTKGILAMVSVARDQGYTSVFVPTIDADEASLVEDIKVYPVSSLRHLIEHLRCESEIQPLDDDVWQTVDDTTVHYEMDLSNVRGQEHAKRALEVAAAGFHNLIFNGPPGSGKTLLARCLPSILPRMAQQEALEVTKIYSVNGALPAGNPLVLQRPFRSPHYTISNAGLVGGGRTLRPGEITMSHRGVLFLDELPEFSHTALESLRQPLEDKVVTISRVSGSITYPASFMLVAAMNPCPCGYHTHPTKECTCSPSTVARYQKRISGPLLDRVDVFVEVPPVEYEKLVEDQQAEDSSRPRLRVEQARAIQGKRFKECGFFCNSEMGPAEVWKFCQLDEGAKGLLQTATQRLNLSARAFHRILKVSRTIADLEGSEGINIAHLAEALQYRPRTAVS
ncbi:MAG: YifB family Mg chelatase-like AAA ATPase [Chloroflexi bacterium]|nr:YifB family Mg chelatase-like AAA ATPase [Chloroflexota bacterium]MCI0811161.1 YifB family Mg chelatase-like AAA ATPase [Chloroflexota bacterium]MCI0863291.1 YifB family Mg chelatase-like AAA ATPase [Chloroflexota bacterium]MCI0898085.1 YifB family Mg chelatase-like AAA ATPase [Chloroflexota bacterium]